jgi:hypothetical protein
VAKLQDLIAKCEESEMLTQNLEENTVAMEVKGENGRITFLTDPQIVLDAAAGKQGKVGYIIWLPSDVFER